MSTKYAENTSVSTEQSRADIERTLRRYNATGFMYAWYEDYATVMFQMNDRSVRFVLPLPDRNAVEFTHTPGRNLPRTEKQAYEQWEQACRQRWRALLLVIKAKLEAVETDITTFDDEFLAHIVTKSGKTVGEMLLPQMLNIIDGTRSPFLMLTQGSVATKATN